MSTEHSRRKRFTQLVTLWDRFIEAKAAFNRVGGNTLRLTMQSHFYNEGEYLRGKVIQQAKKMLPGRDITFLPGTRLGCHALRVDGVVYPIHDGVFPYGEET